MVDNNVYEHIVKNGEFMYFYGEVFLDNQGNILDCEILDINNILQNKVKKSKEEIVNNKLINAIPCSLNWNSIIGEAMENEKYNDIHYIDTFEEWYKIDIEKIDNTKFYVLMDKAYQLDTYTKTLLDVFPAGVWYKDKEGRYITSSKLMLEHERVKDRKVKGKTDTEIQKSKKLAKNIMKHDEEVMNSEKPTQYNTYIDENTRHITQKHCVYDNSGDVIGTIGFYVDTTDHENLKETYHHHKKLTNSIWKSIPDKLAYKDINGMYKYCNKSFLDYLGLEENEVIGKYDFEVFKSDLNQELYIPMTDKIVKENKQPIRYMTHSMRSGEMNHFDVIKTPFKNSKEDVIGIISVIRDVTEQEIVKEQLKQNEELLNNILDGINDAIILSDKNEIIYVNKAIEDIYGVSRKEYINNSNLPYELFTDEYKTILGSYKHEKEYNIQINLNSRDGKNKWIWYKGYLLDDENKEGKKVTIIRDITANKKHSMELEKLRIEFFSNITHELKTPLNLIFSSLQLIDLKKQSDENINDDYLRYTNIIKQNSFRLLKLTNNLIDSTKIESGYLDCKHDNLDIVYFVEQIFNSIEEYARSKNIKLIFDTNLEEKIISIDLDKIERVMLNLLSNAIKFNKENGSIYLTMNVDDNFTEISIKDTGIGIPKNKLESVFERFTQINNRMTKVSEGSGIGLSLSKSLIEMLGGSIDINSELDEGTEFIITIPNNVMVNDGEVIKQQSGDYNSFVKKLEIEFSDIY